MKSSHDQRKQKDLSRTVRAIALPLALQSLLGYTVNVLDTIMIGQLGTAQLSAVALANQVFFIASMAIPGIADGANVLIAQAWGVHDKERIYKVMAYAYRTAIIFILGLMAVTIAIPERVMGIFSTDAVVISIGSRYLKIVVWSYLFYTISNITTGILRSVRTVKIAMYASTLSIVLKLICNFLLIDGRLGFPALGLEGAAIATLAARIGEFILVMLFVYFKENKLVIRVDKLKRLDPSLCKVYYFTSIPVICNEVFWALGASAQAIVLGRLGTEVVAANSIASAISQMTAVLYTGMASAASVVVGNTIGAEEYGDIKYLKKYFQRFAIVLGLVSGFLVLAVIPAVPALYHISGETLVYTRQMMILTALIMPFMAMQIVNIMGLLRGGADVRFQMANDMIFLWGLTVPLGFIAAFVWHAPVWVIFICMKCDQVIKAFTSLWRLNGSRWIHNMTGQQKTNEG